MQDDPSEAVEPTGPMILYHGTGMQHLDAILRSGLQPRRVTKQRSNWKGKFRSKPDFVYLTDAYPVYYAMNPAFRSKQSPSDVLVLQVEVDADDLYPDEDYVTWLMAREGMIPDIYHGPDIDPGDYQEMWHDSLRFNGVACTPHVSAERIIGHRIISKEKIRLMMMIGGDASPTPIAYMFTANLYRNCIKALFEQGEDAAMDAAASYWNMGQAS